VRPFNTADTYPEQQLGNDLCQAVIAGNTIYLRGQVAQDLDTRESVAIGDPAGQAEKEKQARTRGRRSGTLRKAG
jgi:enamine deaminase RidA (YjgF/YER057c/UK114 family)